MMIVLAALLLGGLIATNQARWTPEGAKGVPMEQMTEARGNDRQSSNDTGESSSDKENPHTDSGEAMQQVETNQAGFPKQIGNLKLNEFLIGQEAINSINQLHGMNIEIVQGYVANYGSGSQQVKVWVSEVENTEAAANQVQRMTQKIANESDVYTEPAVFQIKGIDFWQTRGAGMNNYYYRKGKKIYWLATKGVDPASVMGVLLRNL